MSRRRGKYGAMRTTVHDWTFDSKREAARYQALLLLGDAGEIRNLELQPAFPLHACDLNDLHFTPIATYRADFRYEERGGLHLDCAYWHDVVEDVKGMRTPMYRLKKKWLEAEYGIAVRET